ncbi:hypothetical protein Tco_1231775 [Tanacetum coccineum]
MGHPNITMEEYIRLEEEKARRHGHTFNWQTATFEKVKNYKDEDGHPIDFETEFSAIVFDNTLTAIQSEPTVCPPNKNELDFRISLDESDDEDYMILMPNLNELPMLRSLQKDDDDEISNLVDLHWVCLVVDDNIFNLVDLHMGILGGG